MRLSNFGKTAIYALFLQISAVVFAKTVAPSPPVIDLVVSEDVDFDTGWIPFKFGAIDTTVPTIFRIGKNDKTAIKNIGESKMRPHPHGQDPNFPDQKPPPKPAQPVKPFGDQIHGHRPQTIIEKSRFLIRLIDGYCRGDRFGLFINEQQVGHTSFHPDGGYDGCRTNVTNPEEAWDRRDALRMSWLEHRLDEAKNFPSENLHGDIVTLTVLESPRGGGTGFLRLIREPLPFCICDDQQPVVNTASSSHYSTSSSDSDSSSDEHQRPCRSHHHRHPCRRRRRRCHQRKDTETKDSSHHRRRHCHRRKQYKGRHRCGDKTRNSQKRSNTRSSTSSKILENLIKCPHSTQNHTIIMTKFSFKLAARACQRIGGRLAGISPDNVKDVARLLQKCDKSDLQARIKGSSVGWIGKWQERNREKGTCLELLINRSDGTPSGSVNIPKDCSTPRAIICVTRP